MCGRFVLIGNMEQIAEEFNLTDITSSSISSGDIHPGQKAVCVINEDKKNRFAGFTLGIFATMVKAGNKIRIVDQCPRRNFSRKAHL